MVYLALVSARGGEYTAKYACPGVSGSIPLLDAREDVQNGALGPFGSGRGVGRMLRVKGNHPQFEKEGM